MASSPQPADVREGAEAAEVDENPALPANAEDRKAAAAMSSLERRGDDDEDNSKTKNVDTEALGKAMKNLGATEDGGSGVKNEEKKVKIDGSDITLLVSICKNSIYFTDRLLMRSYVTSIVSNSSHVTVHAIAFFDMRNCRLSNSILRRPRQPNC